MNRIVIINLKTAFLALIMCSTLPAFKLLSQDTTLHYPVPPTYDPTQTEKHSFDLGDPSSVKQTIVYDPVTGTYVFRETIGKNLNYRNPSMMTLEEYLEYERKKSMRQNWKDKIESETAKNQPMEFPIKIGSKLFENFFGSDQITIRPQGSVELSFGINSSRYDNPILPVKQRKVTRFDFQQNIQLNLVGQIGTKMKLGLTYNTQASFEFDNITKLEYTGNEDQIVQKIELGNVALSLPTSLIQGSQTLFGAKTKLKFGRATVDLIAASAKGKRQEINISGKAQVQKFELGADNYEANRHYFVNLYHHGHYDEAMSTVPIVNSAVYITRMEVWLTNRTNNTENTRNIVAFADLGEGKPENCQGNPGGFTNDELPGNNVNGLYNWASSQPLVRGFSNAVSVLGAQTNSPGPFQQAIHYEKVENARKLTEQEFTYNALLGYISLNLPINNDEVLAVSYEYTYKGKTYQVGDFSTDGISGQQALFLKLLKPTITNPKNKVWDLMMKNVYSIGAYQVGQTGFKIDLLYNNPETSLPVPFFPLAGIDDKQLVTLLNMDKLNQNNQPFSDGVFDFVPINFNGNKADNGGTINPKNGRIYFSTIEPFGKTLKKKLEDAGATPLMVKQVAFTELYDSTKTAAQQIPSKNRFTFKGEYQSSISSDIPLNAMNVPQGAVSVTAGGIKLIEGTDYTVDYNLGRVKILNSGILESNTPIKISVESNSAFGFQAKSLFGAHYNYRFNENFNIGGTWVRMMERPVTQKVDYGTEPFKNNIIGLDLAYKAEVPFLTKLVDWLPVISTTQKSTFSFKGEFAHLIPGQPSAIGKTGISYVDDFEGAQSSIDLKSSAAWRLASIPQGQPALFPEAANKGLPSGFKRSKIAWYYIDPIFYQATVNTPAHIKNNALMLADSRMRLVNQTDIFPNLQQQYGSVPNLTMLDLAYYPKERGMYNYDTTNTINPDGTFINPADRWGGIMRSLTTNDFEQTNIEFIQFWMLDPFNDDAENANPNTPHTGGDLYFNLGNISEDVLPDSRKSFENGLPPTGVAVANSIDTTAWARVSKQQVVVNAFDNNATSRANQDVGLDGWNNAQEATAFQNYVNWVQNNPTINPAVKTQLINDPSGDDYTYYLDDKYDAAQLDMLKRYKKYNGQQGNSPTTEMSTVLNSAGYLTQATNSPDLEDINQDNNLSESESYFQYKVSLRSNDMQVGKNFITNMQTYQNGTKTEKWYQFKVPIQEYEKKINGIQDFRSIRFMRMFMKNFDEETVLRFAKLEFVRSEWRRFNEDLTQPGESVQADPNLTNFSVTTVNVEENDQRTPVKYEIPPGILREVDPSQTYQRQLNEQALMMTACGLQDGDARAAYKNVQFDVRTYKKLKLFVHAEEVSKANPLKDQDLTLFVRLGTDFKDNYYEYELPLYKTQWGATTAEEIWPESNNVEIIFDNLLAAKKKRNALIDAGNTSVSYVVEYVINDPENGNRRLKVKGSPNLQGIKTIMIGVRNPGKSSNQAWPDDGLAKCAIIWVNELRLSDFVSEGGSAAVAQLQTQLADFANISMSGNYSGINWGSVESRVQDRQRNQRIGFDMNATVQLGQFFGKKAGVSLPFFYGYSLGIINPEYDPFNPDVKLADYDLSTRLLKSSRGQDFTERKSYNFTNVRKELKAGGKANLLSISNFNASYSYTENMHRDFNTNYDRTKTWTSGLNYNYSFSNKPFEPFKKWKPVQKSKWLALIKDININLLPKNISFTNDLMRSYNERQVRNNLFPDYKLPPVYVKRFTWNRNYTIGYELTRNLKATFSASTKAIFEEGDGAVDKGLDPVRYQAFKDSISSQLKTLGRTMDYSHNYSVTYNLPLDKLPLTDWLTANVKYGGTYNWLRAPLGQSNFGNIIQNNRTVGFTGQMNFTNLYNKVPFLKKINTEGKTGSSRGNVDGRKIDEKKPADDAQKGKEKEVKTLEPDKPVEEMTDKERRKWERKKRRWERKQERKKRREEREKKRDGKVNPVVGFLGRSVMSLRNVSGTYTLNDGTLLPGYNQESRLLGFNPSMDLGLGGFILGQQRYDIWGRETGYNIARTAASNGWLVKNENLNKQYTMTHTANLNIRASLEPIKDVTVELTFSRNFGNNSTEFFRWNSTTNQYEGQSKVETGTLTYTNVSIASAFDLIGADYQTSSFNQLLANRAIVSQLLGGANANSTALTSGYYKGYSGSQQEVVTGAFITAYSNRGISERNINPLKNIPLPNWSLNYSGLTKYKFTKKILKSFVVRHSYSSTVSVAGLQTNLNAQFDNNGNATSLDVNNNFIASRQLQNITMSERFSPLIGIDATWNIRGQGFITKFEYKKDRSATLSLNNNQVTEVNGTELVIGTGYKFIKVKLPFGKLPPSDVNFRFDLTIRDNLTVIRKIVENTNQATAGQRVVSIKSSLDYNASQNLVIQLYYDQVINTPKIATAYPTGNMSCGVRLRFNLAGVQ